MDPGRACSPDPLLGGRCLGKRCRESELVRDHRAPDRPRVVDLLEQAGQHVLAGCILRAGRIAKTLPDDRAGGDVGIRERTHHELAVLVGRQRRPPKALAGTAYALDHRDLRIKCLGMAGRYIGQCRGLLGGRARVGNLRQALGDGLPQAVLVLQCQAHAQSSNRMADTRLANGPNARSMSASPTPPRVSGVIGSNSMNRALQRTINGKCGAASLSKA